jgi:hypothetical protein
VHCAKPKPSCNHPAERHVLQKIHSVVFYVVGALIMQNEYCDLIVTGPIKDPTRSVDGVQHQASSIPSSLNPDLATSHSPGSVPSSLNYLGLAYLPELPACWYMNGLAACPLRSPLFWIISPGNRSTLKQRTIGLVLKWGPCYRCEVKGNINFVPKS